MARGEPMITQLTCPRELFRRQETLTLPLNDPEATT